MMKKRWIGILALALTAVGCCTLGACNDAEKAKKVKQGNRLTKFGSTTAILVRKPTF